MATGSTSNLVGIEPATISFKGGHYNHSAIQLNLNLALHFGDAGGLLSGFNQRFESDLKLQAYGNCKQGDEI
jgi:hypothetical protein